MQGSSVDRVRQAENRKALEAFGTSPSTKNALLRTIATGCGPGVFTIGYERRDSEDLISRLVDNDIDVLVDVRQRAMSRKADFRGAALAASCQAAGIEYLSMPTLGSTDELRDELKESGDFDAFARGFRKLARKKEMKTSIEELARLATKKTIAMICYERCHDECHRSVIAEELHKRIDATVIAIQ